MNYSISHQMNALILLLVYTSSVCAFHSISKRYQIPVSNPKNILQSDHPTIKDNIVDRFHTNVHTIIRTHDSRELGAKYLNEREMVSNEDCLYWCWQTNRCNLAVHEEIVSFFLFLSFQLYSVPQFCASITDWEQLFSIRLRIERRLSLQIHCKQVLLEFHTSGQ